MKRKFSIAIIIFLLVITLTACQCKHDWVAADCTTAKTCTRCDEVVGTPLGHAWVSATCTTAKTCSACGRTEGSPKEHSWIDATCLAPATCLYCEATLGYPLGHNWINATCTTSAFCTHCNDKHGTPLGHSWTSIVNESGIEGGICTVCEEIVMDTYSWTPLTKFERVAVSNADAHEKDLLVGDWDSQVGKLPDSIRFCVSNQKHYKNTHYCVYELNGNYDCLSGLISFCDKSADFSTAQVYIYLDNELAYESITLSDTNSYDTFKLDLDGVDLVRVVCFTTDGPAAYCVVSASVY